MVASELDLGNGVISGDSVVVIDGAFIAGRIGFPDGFDATTWREVRKGNVDNWIPSVTYLLAEPTN